MSAATPDTSRQYPLALTELFATSTRRDMLRWLFDQADPDEWYRKVDIADATGRSGESVRTNLTVLREFAIVAVRDPDARIRHYRLAESESVELLSLWEESIDVLTTLLDGTARQELATFFLDTADPEETYSRYAIHEQAGIGYGALREHIEVFVSHGFLTTEDGVRSTEYQRGENDLVRYCYTLNEALANAYRESTTA